MKTSSIALDSENSLHYIDNFLTEEEQLGLRSVMLSVSLKQPTAQIFGNKPKFFDATFSYGTQTVPNRSYKQVLMTPQATSFSTLLKTKFDQVHNNQATKHFNCNLVYYAPHLANGGSRGVHSDNPSDPLQLVLIYSYGQDRPFTIYRDKKIVQRICLKHNSIVAMQGSSFQKVFKHRLDPLKKGVVAEDRWSFNTRFT